RPNPTGERAVKLRPCSPRPLMRSVLRERQYCLVPGRCRARSYSIEYVALSLPRQVATRVQGSSAKHYNKPARLWKQGKHKGTLNGILSREHERPEKPQPPMYDPPEFFALLRKKRKQG